MRSQPWERELSVEQVLDKARSDNQGVRATAMAELLRRVQGDAGIHAAALPVFRESLQQPRDAWTALSAARGVGCIEGIEEGRRAMLALLEQPDTQLVSSVASVMSDRSYLPVLLDLLNRNSDRRVQVSAICALGRMKDPAAFPALIEKLKRADVRPNVADALGDLGDARAIAHLEPLLTDRADAWEEDNHGPMLRVCDVAQAAIDRLRRPAPPTAATAARPPALPTVETGSSHPSINPGPPRAARPKLQLLAFVPLIAAVVELPWVVIVIILSLDKQGHLTQTRSKTHALDVISMLPALAGLLAALIVVTRTRNRLLGANICLVVGCIGCALFIVSFGWELMH